MPECLITVETNQKETTGLVICMGTKMRERILTEQKKRKKI